MQERGMQEPIYAGTTLPGRNGELARSCAMTGSGS